MEKVNEKRIARFIAKIEKFNKNLEEYFDKSGDEELPIIDSTIVGFDPYEKPKITRLENGFICNLDGWDYEVKVEIDEDGEEDIYGWYDLLDGLKYDQRRLKKAWRIYRSENPDAELEKDEE